MMNMTDHYPHEIGQSSAISSQSGEELNAQQQTFWINDQSSIEQQLSYPGDLSWTVDPEPQTQSNFIFSQSPGHHGIVYRVWGYGNSETGISTTMSTNPMLDHTTSPTDGQLSIKIKTAISALSNAPSQPSFDGNRVKLYDELIVALTAERKEVLRKEQNDVIGIRKKIQAIVPEDVSTLRPAWDQPLWSDMDEVGSAALDGHPAMHLRDPTLSPPKAATMANDYALEQSEKQSTLGYFHGADQTTSTSNRENSQSVPCTADSYESSPDCPYENPTQPLLNGPSKHQFKCKLCSSQFTRAITLDEHIRTHKNEKPFACSKCPKAFARHKDKNRHEKLHTDVKAFGCNGPNWGCGRHFGRKDGLLAHLRTDRAAGCLKPLLDVTRSPFVYTSFQRYMSDQRYDGRYICSSGANLGNSSCNATFEQLQDFMAHLYSESAWRCAKPWLMKFVLG